MSLTSSLVFASSEPLIASRSAASASFMVGSGTFFFCRRLRARLRSSAGSSPRAASE